MAEISKIQPMGSSTQYDLSALKIKVNSTSAPSSVTTYRLIHCNATDGYTEVGVANTIGLWRDSTSNYLIVGNNASLGGVTLHKGNGKYADLVPGSLTANRTITFPDESGTVAIANSANSGYVRKTGDTMTGELFVKRTTATDTLVNVQNSKGSISLDAAASGNRGIWDHTGSKWLIYADGSSTKISSGYPIYGAVWNDYAEMRNVPEANEYDETKKRNIKLAGRCVHEVGDDTMVLSTERMQPGCKIISDTFGFNIGETDDCKTPIAVSGRALVYIYEGREVARQHIGQPVCSGPDGTVSIMTDEEYAAKGYCCIGTISAIPEYETWGSGNIQVDGRIWIYVR